MAESAASHEDPEITIRRTVGEVLGDVSVGDLVRLTGGASRSTWRCTIDGQPIVVQRQRADSDHDMAAEAAVVRAASESGVPVPELLAFHDDGGVATMVTRHVEGETIARRILRDDRFARARTVLAEQLGRALARIHRIDAGALTGLDLVDPLDAARDRLDEIGQPHPAFELAFQWLDDHRPPVTAATLVHGDYRLGNVIVDDDGLCAVLDWELAHLGDPVEDLGWLCTPAWRFGATLPVAGVGTRAALLDAYADEAGVRIDIETLRWWEICGIVRWGIICVAQAETHRSGVVRSHELAAIGRRVCETEHDVFLALEGRW